MVINSVRITGQNPYLSIVGIGVGGRSKNTSRRSNTNGELGVDWGKENSGEGGAELAKNVTVLELFFRI